MSPTRCCYFGDPMIAAGPDYIGARTMRSRVTVREFACGASLVSTDPFAGADHASVGVMGYGVRGVCRVSWSWGP
jgi:hypothetical protein